MSLSPVKRIHGINFLWRLKHEDTESVSCFSKFDFKWPSTERKLEISYLGEKENGFQLLYIAPVSAIEANFKLFGTVFIITTEKSFNRLGNFEFSDLCSDLPKKIILKALNDLPCARGVVFPNDTLTLLIQLWDSPEKEINANFYIHTRVITQKCCFRFTLMNEPDQTQAGHSIKYVVKVPAELKSAVNKNVANLVMTLLIERFSKSSSGMEVHHRNWIAIEASEEVVMKCKLKVIGKEGDSITVLDSAWINTDERKLPRIKLTNIQELISKKHLYFPDGNIIFECNVASLPFSEGTIEGFDYISITKNPEAIFEQIEKSGKSKQQFKSLYETLNDSMYNLYQKRECFDASLRVGDQTFGCHKAVLCARSTVFKSMFENDREDNSLALDIDAQTFSVFLTSLYTDKLDDLDWTGALKLYSAADKYKVSLIQKHCSEFLLSRLSISNVCELLEFSETHTDEYLKQKVQEFFCEHVKEIIFSSDWTKITQSNTLLAAEMMKLAISKLT